MLKINNLCANVGDVKILKGVNLTINPGEIHAIMGPNGSGKSTLANVIAGDPAVVITKGNIEYYDEDLSSQPIEERAQKGIFLAFQYPVVLPGVSNIQFLKESYNSIRKAKKLSCVDAMDFLTIVQDKLTLLGLSDEFLYRYVNDGFSGGEKKKNEMAQMALLEPDLSVLDETDSGLDIDSLKIVANGVQKLKNNKRSFLIITHYQRLLNYIVPDFVHVLKEGRIVESGDQSLAHKLEKQGYKSFGN